MLIIPGWEAGVVAPVEVLAVEEPEAVVVVVTDTGIPPV